MGPDSSGLGSLGFEPPGVQANFQGRDARSGLECDCKEVTRRVLKRNGSRYQDFERTYTLKSDRGKEGKAKKEGGHNIGLYLYQPCSKLFELERGCV